MSNSDFGKVLEASIKGFRVLINHMSSSEWDKVLETYTKGLDTIETSAPSPSLEHYLNVLITRDEIERLLEEKGPVASYVLLKLRLLDDRFKQQKEILAQTVPLAEWRQIVEPPDTAWWWHFKASEPSMNLWTRLARWLWKGLTIPTLTLNTFNFALVAAISSRFLVGGPDALGVSAVLGQSAIALLAAGGPLPKAGNQIIERFLQAIPLPKNLAKLIISFTIFSVLIGFQASLPIIAKYYYVQRGFAAQKKQETTNALAKYQRAIELDPNNLEAHFRLGSTYEDLLDFDQARSAYRIAMLGGCIEAYNNLARLYIVQDQDYSAASTLLNQGRFKLNNYESLNVTFCSTASLERMQHTLLKNLGWTRLMQERPIEAEGLLRESIKLNKKAGAPYCLLAQVLEKKGDQDMALEEWEKCKLYARILNTDEDQWLDMAQNRLSEAEQN